MIQSLATKTIQTLIKFDNQRIQIPKEDIIKITAYTQNLFRSGPTLLRIPEPDETRRLNIVGDIHGQFDTLLEIFRKGGLPDDTDYIFLGDYVDRGRYSIECILLLFCFKILYPENFYMIRGNHETEAINYHYGFYKECMERYDHELWNRINRCFDWMPIAALVADRIFCVHAGLSPQLKTIEQIENIPRPSTIPESGLMCDLTWSDPNPEIIGFGPSTREISYNFGLDEIQKFVKRNDIDLICRSHELMEKGYNFICDHKFLTIFSATNYCGDCQNDGAFVSMDHNLNCRFVIMKYK